MTEPLQVEGALAVVRRARDDPRAVTEDDLADACEVLAAEAVASQKHLLSMRGVDGAPDWYGQEMAVWQLGEVVRAYLVVRKQIRGRTPLLDRLASMLDDTDLGKGRGNLAQVVGTFGKEQYIAELGRHLEDPELSSQVLECLLRDRVFGYEDRAAAILETGSPLARRYARKYLKFIAES